MKKCIWGILYGILLTAFTLYVLLDTFVITRVYSETPQNENGFSSLLSEGEGEKSKENSSEEATDEKETDPDASHGNVTESSYVDENISVTVKEYRENGTSIFVADVQLSSPQYLKTAFAKGAYGKNVTEKTSEIAENAGAILAINGDYYGSREKGYVIRNGVLYRSTPTEGGEALVLYEDGSCEIVSEEKVSAASLLDNGAAQVLSFGPALVTEGKIAVGENDEVGKAMASNPRTAIGIVDELHYLLVVSDGRTSASRGLSLRELAAFMQSLGAKTAYNLDGGGSSTMVFNGEVINHPTTNGKSIKERSVSDIVYVGY